MHTNHSSVSGGGEEASKDEEDDLHTDHEELQDDDYDTEIEQGRAAWNAAYSIKPGPLPEIQFTANSDEQSRPTWALGEAARAQEAVEGAQVLASIARGKGFQ